ncbi:MAG TPA: hypothetical protein PKC49_07145 [Phycisphaerae bacterium]|nr:hypothetical protein [Phycisphaerae bacterium]
MRLSTRPPAWSLGLLAVAPAAAQHACFLSPERFAVTHGTEARVRVLAGDALAPAPVAWPADVAWLFSRSPGVQENLESAAPAADGLISVLTGRIGVTVIGLDLPPSEIALSAGEWESFRRARLPRMRVAESAAGREAIRIRHVRSAKTLVRVREAGIADNASAGGESSGAPSAEAVSKTGQKAELRPLMDATRLRVGDDLAICVYADNIRRRNVRVTAVSVSAGAEQRVDVGEGGLANVRITHAGPWRIVCYIAEAADAAVPADIVLYSATLTFEAEGGA